MEFDGRLIFQGFERIFGGIVAIFGDVKSGGMLDFSVMRMGKNSVKWTFCRTHYRNRKWGFRRENNRYAVLDFRLHVLKCKPRPHI